jgi:probable blue pigment (indigoidine) exporter
MQQSNWRWVAVTAVAPVTWGSTYFVTRHFLPADHALWGAAIRALPAGLLLLLLARRLPRGAWWWRSLVLGVLNFGGFFVLLYLAALLLPSSVAASIMALAPVVLAGLGWLLLAERPTAFMAAGAALGIAGVLLIVGAGAVATNPWGVLCSVVALLLSSVGGVLNKKWLAAQADAPAGGPADAPHRAGPAAERVPVLASTAWQATAGGLLLLVVAAAVEGPPPALDATAWVGFGYLTLVATALASVCWFAGLSRLPAGTVGIVGLLNPVTGVLLGVLAGAEQLSWLQASGIALVLVGILLGRRVTTGKRERGGLPTEVGG